MPTARLPTPLPDGAAPHEEGLPTLQAGPWRVVVAPDCGGAIAAFYQLLPDGRRRDWLRPASAQALAERDPLRCASFALVPWCNRIRDGRGQHAGRHFALPSNFRGTPHTIHGTGWMQRWQLAGPSAELMAEPTAEPAAGTSATPLRLTLQHRPDDPATLPWPWRFEAEQLISLADDGSLTLTLSARNTDDAPMPLGLGHHPYFPGREQLRLRTQVRAQWQADAEVLPTVLDGQAPVLAAMAGGMALADWVLDHNFSGWQRQAELHWADSGDRLLLRAEAGLDHLVVYSPEGQDFCCVEPVGNCTDWLNLAARGQTGAGGRVLAPGEQLCTVLRLLPRPANGG